MGSWPRSLFFQVTSSERSGSAVRAGSLWSTIARGVPANAKSSGKGARRESECHFRHSWHLFTRVTSSQRIAFHFSRATQRWACSKAIRWTSSKCYRKFTGYNISVPKLDEKNFKSSSGHCLCYAATFGTPAKFYRFVWKEGRYFWNFNAVLLKLTFLDEQLRQIKLTKPNPRGKSQRPRRNYYVIDFACRTGGLAGPARYTSARAKRELFSSHVTRASRNLVVRVLSFPPRGLGMRGQDPRDEVALRARSPLFAWNTQAKLSLYSLLVSIICNTFY